MNKKPKIFSNLEELASLVPSPIAWLDTNGVVLGGNFFQVVGATRPLMQIVGKTAYDFYPKDIADIIIRNIKLVAQEKKSITFEERIVDLSTGKARWFLTTRGPLFDDDKIDVVGVVETAVEITDRKEAEQLRLEVGLHKEQIKEQQKFVKVIDKVVHDIRTPLTSIIMQLRFNATEIPENVRISLNESVTNVLDIANNLLDGYKKDGWNVDFIEEQRPSIVSLMLLQVLSAKRYQYKDLSVKFIDEFCPNSAFVFIKVQPSHFVRAISNLINNSVEAFEGKKGTVRLGLNFNEENVVITIQDNGKGMPKKVIDKILSGGPVATDKKNGHGIGLTQIREVIEHNQGKLDVKSVLGKGTRMILTFPIIEQPDWIARNIKLNKGDTIIVLDDDSSIHGAWDSYFRDYANDVHIKHFTIGSDAISFINTFPEKDKIFLLTDQELLNQDITGVDIIKMTGIKRSILVTSHHGEKDVYKLIIENGIKLLPKQLASEVHLEICDVNQKSKANETKDEKIDVVVIEDDKNLADTESMFFRSRNKKVDTYYSPDVFLQNVHKYDKNTIMCIDHAFKGSSINGFDVAKQLHELGFTKLYLFSGREFEKSEIPKYLTAFLKTDIDAFIKLAKG